MDKGLRVTCQDNEQIKHYAIRGEYDLIVLHEFQTILRPRFLEQRQLISDRGSVSYHKIDASHIELDGNINGEWT
jgi:hypothetical protein